MKRRKVGSILLAAGNHPQLKKATITKAGINWQFEHSLESSWKLEASRLGQGRSTSRTTCSVTAHGTYVLWVTD